MPPTETIPDLDLTCVYSTFEDSIRCESNTFLSKLDDGISFISDLHLPVTPYFGRSSLFLDELDFIRNSCAMTSLSHFTEPVINKSEYSLSTLGGPNSTDNQKVSEVSNMDSRYDGLVISFCKSTMDRDLEYVDLLPVYIGSFYGLTCKNDCQELFKLIDHDLCLYSLKNSHIPLSHYNSNNLYNYYFIVYGVRKTS